MENQFRHKKLLIVSLSIAFLFACCSASLAQIVSGSIVGSVRDESGAAVPGVTITATSRETGFQRPVISDQFGRYAVSPLSPGTYELRAELAGFKTEVVQGVIIQIEQSVRLDFVLKVGELREVVTVSAASILLETQNSGLGQVMDEKRITDLPLDGRSYVQLISLSTGAVAATVNTSPAAAQLRRENTSAHVSGARGDQLSFLLDGVETKWLEFGSVSMQPSVDAIQEFKVQRNAFSAEYGNASAVINVSIKPGTNALHGSLYAFHRNDNLDARNFFDQTNPEFKRSHIGGAVGGPIRRNKTFFFVNYEALREGRGRTILATVPEPEQLKGNFSSLRTAVRDPDTGQPFPQNIIPTSRISKFGEVTRSLFPSPNAKLTGANLVVTPTNTHDGDQFHARIDQNLSVKDQLFGRFSLSNDDLGLPSFARWGGEFRPIDARNAALQETHIFGPKLVNVVKLGYHRVSRKTVAELADRNIAQESGLRNLRFPSDVADVPPRITISGFSTYGSIFSAFFGDIQNLSQFSDTLKTVWKNHNLTTGVDLRLYKVRFALGQATRLSFNGQMTGNAVADYLLGIPATAQSDVTVGTTHWNMDYYSFFLQDDIRVSPKFTLNLGVRYEISRPPREERGLVENFNFSTGKLELSRSLADLGIKVSLPSSIEVVGFRETFLATDKNNWGPRVGFAWNPTGNTVVRSGYGIFYVVPQVADILKDLGSAILVNPSYSLNSPTQPNFRIDRGDVFPSLEQAFRFGGALTTSPVDPRWRSPYVHQWNLSIQRQMKEFLFEVGYEGSKGTNLLRRWNANSGTLPADRALQQRRPYPQFSDMTMKSFEANSSYNALQLRSERRFTKGFALLASYTFGKSIDSESFLAFQNQNPRNRRVDRARSDYDVRNRFVSSYIYEIPLGHGTSGLRKALLRGWQVNGILAFQSGYPVNLIEGTDRASVGGGTLQRPDRLKAGNLPPSQRKPEQWFDIGAFGRAAIGTFGTSGRNVIDGPGFGNFDFSIFKNTSVGEKTLQFRAEFFNITNHPNFDRPNRFINQPANFGTITSALNAREIQFAVKFLF